MCSCGPKEFFLDSKGNMKEFFWLVVCIPWARILLLFDESVFLACVLHTLGTNPAAVRGFRKCIPRLEFETISERFQWRN